MTGLKNKSFGHMTPALVAKMKSNSFGHMSLALVAKMVMAIFVMVMMVMLGGCKRVEEPVSSFAQLDQVGRSYAVQTGSGSATIAEEYFKRAEEKQYSTLEDCIQAVSAGKVDAAIYDENVLRYYKNQDTDALAILGDEIPVERNMGVAFPKTDAGAARRDEFNRFLASIKADGTFDDIFNRWVIEGDEEMPDIEEAQDPAAKLNIGVVGVIAPFNYIKDNELVGFDIELMKRFAAYEGVAIEFRVEPMTSLITDLEAGKIDLSISNLYMSKERMEAANFSDVMYVSHSGAIIQNHDKQKEGNIVNCLASSFEKTIIREQRWKLIVNGLGLTIIISLGTIVLGTIIGFALCIVSRIQIPLCKDIVNAFCKVINGIPMLVTLMIFFYLILVGTDLPEVVVAIIAFSVDFGVHVKGILDTGISAVMVGEVEAAYALGMSRSQVFSNVILPQAIAHVMGLYRGQIVSLVKATSIVGYIAIQDLTKASDIIRARTFEAFFPLIIIAVLYFRFLQS